MKTFGMHKPRKNTRQLPGRANVPVIALVGRPNVGKSTLFNRLTRSRDAIVSDFPGLTRDRKYGTSFCDDQQFIWVDTGGLIEIAAKDHSVESLMAGQSLQAIQESNLVLMLVDAKVGLTPSDEEIANHLRREGKLVVLVINKVDGKASQLLDHDFYTLGFAQAVQTAAVHGRGIDQLLEVVCEHFSTPESESMPDTQITESKTQFDDEALDPAEALPVIEKTAADTIKIAIVGRPNVGKSTLMNRMLGDERSLVFDMPGTTRDSIYESFERREQAYTLIDTAGVRRRGKIERGVERFSVVKTLSAIADAHVVLLMLDAQEGLVDQDLHLLGFVLETGRASVLVCNKWDGLTHDHKKQLKSELDRRLEFADYLKVHYVSALHGTGVGDLFHSVNQAYRSANTQVKTPVLTAHLEQAVSQHQPPLVRGRRIKLRYAHMGGICPPRIVIHGNQTQEVPKSYRRYLQNYFRKALKIKGTPILFEFKTGKNPFEGRTNKLTDRQLKKRKRLMRFVKT